MGRWVRRGDVRGRTRRMVAAWIAGCLAHAGVAGAESPAGAPSGPTGATGPGEKVGLDQLLELPDSLDYGGQEKGGLTRGEWRARFQSLREQLDNEKRLLAAAQAELGEIAGSADAWSVGPPIPGAGASDAPLDYRLRQEITRHKDEIERLERALRDLQVRADLVGVPDDWRE